MSASLFNPRNVNMEAQRRRRESSKALINGREASGSLSMFSQGRAGIEADADLLGRYSRSGLSQGSLLTSSTSPLTTCPFIKDGFHQGDGQEGHVGESRPSERFAELRASEKKREKMADAGGRARRLALA